MRRARLVRVLLVYLAAGWLLLQVTSLFIQSFDLPAWFLPAAVLLLAIGLVIVVATAWVQSHPHAASRAARDEVPASWEIDLGDATASVKQGRLPHLTWARALLGGACAFVLLFAIAGAYAILRDRATPENPRRVEGASATAGRTTSSIAVLPFVNLSADEENQYFADGLTEDVITHLSKIGALRVISRTSVMRYKDTQKGLPEIAAELGVEKLIEGSVRRLQDRVRITAQLIDASTDEHVWAETYDRQMSDIFLIQSDIARQIAAALEAEVSPAERERLERAPTGNLTAYEYYLKGREHMRLFTRNENERAIQLFNSALKLDPRFALARASRSLALSQGIMSFVARPKSELDVALEEAEMAIALDTDLAEGHHARGWALEGFGRLREAAEEFKRAIEVNPNHAAATSELGYLSMQLGNLSQALHLAQEAVRLDPSFADHRWLVGEVYLWLGDFDESMNWTEQALDLHPDHPYARNNLVWLHLVRGDLELARSVVQQTLSLGETYSSLLAGAVALFAGELEEAEAQLERANAVETGGADFAFPWLGHIYLQTDRRDVAVKLLQPRVRELRNRITAGDERVIWRYELAGIYAVLGNKAEAYEWLEEGVRRAPGFWILVGDLANRDPMWERLRGDERFQRLMRDFHAAVEKQRRQVQSETSTRSRSFQTGRGSALDDDLQARSIEEAASPSLTL
jgi:TolB-like protein/Flp pilus assembly protein TadD